MRRHGIGPTLTTLEHHHPDWGRDAIAENRVFVALGVVSAIMSSSPKGAERRQMALTKVVGYHRTRHRGGEDPVVAVALVGATDVGELRLHEGVFAKAGFLEFDGEKLGVELIDASAGPRNLEDNCIPEGTAARLRLVLRSFLESEVPRREWQQPGVYTLHDDDESIVAVICDPVVAFRRPGFGVWLLGPGVRALPRQFADTVHWYTFVGALVLRLDSFRYQSERVVYFLRKVAEESRWSRSSDSSDLFSVMKHVFGEISRVCGLFAQALYGVRVSAYVPDHEDEYIWMVGTNSDDRVTIYNVDRDRASAEAKGLHWFGHGLTAMRVVGKIGTPVFTQGDDLEVYVEESAAALFPEGKPLAKWRIGDVLKERFSGGEDERSDDAKDLASLAGRDERGPFLFVRVKLPVPWRERYMVLKVSGCSEHWLWQMQGERAQRRAEPGPEAGSAAAAAAAADARPSDAGSGARGVVSSTQVLAARVAGSDLFMFGIHLARNELLRWEKHALMHCAKALIGDETNRKLCDDLRELIGADVVSILVASESCEVASAPREVASEPREVVRESKLEVIASSKDKLTGCAYEYRSWDFNTVVLVDKRKSRACGGAQMPDVEFARWKEYCDRAGISRDQGNVLAVPIVHKCKLVGVIRVDGAASIYSPLAARITRHKKLCQPGVHDARPLHRPGTPPLYAVALLTAVAQLVGSRDPRAPMALDLKEAMKEINDAKDWDEKRRLARRLVERLKRLEGVNKPTEKLLGVHRNTLRPKLEVLAQLLPGERIPFRGQKRRRKV